MSAGVISLSAKRVQRNIAAYYQLPIPERCEAYKELREQHALERTRLVGSFLAKHGHLSPTKQLAQLFPSVRWKNAERRNLPDALVYIVPLSNLCDLYGERMDEVTGKVIADEDLYGPGSKKLAGRVALIVRPEDKKSGPEFIAEHEMDHIRHFQFPCHGMAEQAEAKYLKLKPRFYEEMAAANNGAVEIIGMDGFEIIGIRKDRPRMRREGSAPALISEAASAYMQLVAYQLLFEASAVLSSFSSYLRGSAGSYETIREAIEKGGLEWTLGMEIKEVTREINHMLFNLIAVKRTFPGDKTLTGAIDNFDRSSTVFAYRIAKAMSKLSRSSSEPEALKTAARATQILSYEELTVGSVEEAVKAILLTKLSAY